MDSATSATEAVKYAVSGKMLLLYGLIAIGLFGLIPLGFSVLNATDGPLLTNVGHFISVGLVIVGAVSAVGGLVAVLYKVVTDGAATNQRSSPVLSD